MKYFLFTIIFICITSATYAKSINKESPIKVIYDTDMCLDVDDVGGLAVLHGLENEQKVKILGVCYNEIHPLGVSVIDAINTWYGRGTIPIGIYKNYQGNFKNPDTSDYFSSEKDYDVDNYPHNPLDNIVGCAISVYKYILEQQEDESVVIISVGFLNNLYDLLKDPEGYDLIKKKVKLLAVMGGLNGGGFNFTRHNLSELTKYVFDNWPGKMVITDAGSNIITGETLTTKTPINNPVRRAYELEWRQGPKIGRCSWDQVTVMYAIFEKKFFKNSTSQNGWLKINDNEKYILQLKDGYREYAVPLNYLNLEKEIERLMTLSPKE